MQSEDEQFLIDLQKIADVFGDFNEIEVDSNLFFRLLAINTKCPKKMFY